MTHEELRTFLDENTSIEFRDDEDNEVIMFRHVGLPWYQKDNDRATSVSYAKLDEITNKELMDAITCGLRVEGMTRITGYFSKISGWNGGKLAELRDRRKTNLEGVQNGISFRELNELQKEMATA